MNSIANTNGSVEVAERVTTVAVPIVDDYGLLACQSPQMGRVLSVTRRVAASSLPVLITGENGTEKNVLAQYIHRHSPYADGPFISIDRDTIAASTCANADEGSLYLDEIADLPPAQQAKILRLTQDQPLEKPGAAPARQVAVRFISATSASLDSLIAEKGFRQDLLYRLNGITLEIPPLRRRRADILPLAEYFLERARERYGATAHCFCDGARMVLQRYSWPGNARELQYVVERSALLAHREQIRREDLHWSTNHGPNEREIQSTPHQALFVDRRDLYRADRRRGHSRQHRLQNAPDRSQGAEHRHCSPGHDGGDGQCERSAIAENL